MSIQSTLLSKRDVGQQMTGKAHKMGTTKKCVVFATE